MQEASKAWPSSDGEPNVGPDIHQFSELQPHHPEAPNVKAVCEAHGARNRASTLTDPPTHTNTVEACCVLRRGG